MGAPQKKSKYDPKFFFENFWTAPFITSIFPLGSFTRKRIISYQNFSASGIWKNIALLRLLSNKADDRFG